MNLAKHARLSRIGPDQGLRPKALNRAPVPLRIRKERKSGREIQSYIANFLIYKNIEKQYDLDLFYNNPTLAYPMINLKKSKSNDKKLEIEENRRNSKTINNKYDWNKKEFC